MSPAEFRFLRRWYPAVAAAIEEAVSSGKNVDRVLVRSMGRVRGASRVFLVAALGDLRTPGAGDVMLRKLLRTSGPGSRDLRCAALVALAKRRRARATGEFLEALGHRDGDLRIYAVTCLGRFGAVGGWDPVLQWLKSYHPRRPAIPSPVLAAVAYLLRQPNMRRRIGREQLASALRVRWDEFDEDAVKWVLQVWPGVRPDGPVDPGAARVSRLRLEAQDWALLFS